MNWTDEDEAQHQANNEALKNLFLVVLLGGVFAFVTFLALVSVGAW